MTPIVGRLATTQARTGTPPLPKLPILDPVRFALLACAWACCLAAAAANAAAALESIPGVRLIPTEWADGDSFEVQFPSGAKHTIRLYGADAFELNVTDRADARRLQQQRRYFGITYYSEQVPESIALAKTLGAEAKAAVGELLAEPFTVHTAFADGGGDGRYRRIYGFISLADGRDLATVLVERGLARAFGVYRGTPEGLDRDDYREQLKDAELRAAAQRKGAWAYTDWDEIGEQRRQQRLEDREFDLATGRSAPAGPLDINTAARDDLMRIPGIGEHFANAIIEHRPYTNVEELLRVPGIGEKRLARLRDWVSVGR
jgi:competence protein ComEA